MHLHLQILTFLGVIGVGVNAAAQWAGMENLPNGPYSGSNFPNGTTVMTSLSTGTKYTFHLTEDIGTKQLRRSDHAIAKRKVDCWGYQLDTVGVDVAVQNLKSWARPEGSHFASCRRTNYFGYNENGVYVYYCINALHTQSNLDINDIDFALSNMDRTCRPYEAGYFRWEGSVEIVGKCRSGTPVCLM